MKPLPLSPEQGVLALSALRSVALADAELTEPEREMLAMHADLFSFTGAIEAIPDLDADGLARALPDAAHRAALVQRLVLMALIDGKLGEREVQQTRQIARALGVFQPAVDQMDLFVKGHIKRLSVDLMRRSFLFGELRRVWKDEGLRGMFALSRQARGVPDAELATRYLELAKLDEGTFGRALFEHFRAAGFAMPGEAGGAPETLLFHDLGHVLTGYGTAAEGEVQMAGFEAGYMGEDGFGITVIALYLFHLGADVNPTADATEGAFSLAPFRAAFALGVSAQTDLRSWDPWPHMDRPVEAVRSELGLAVSV